MARALGLIVHREALATMEEICAKNEPHDMLTTVAATSFVRLSRASLADATPVLRLLEFADYSVATGAMDALGIDRMVPPTIRLRRSWPGPIGSAI